MGGVGHSECDLRWKRRGRKGGGGWEGAGEISGWRISGFTPRESQQCLLAPSFHPPFLMGGRGENSAFVSRAGAYYGEGTRGGRRKKEKKERGRRPMLGDKSRLTSAAFNSCAWVETHNAPPSPFETDSKGEGNGAWPGLLFRRGNIRLFLREDVCWSDIWF